MLIIFHYEQQEEIIKILSNSHFSIGDHNVPLKQLFDDSVSLSENKIVEMDFTP